MKKIMFLIASLMVAIVPWGTSLPNWEVALTTGNFFGLIGIIGGVILAWLGQSPLRVR